MSLKLLQDNLIEIESALSSQATSLPLVADPFYAKRLYHTAYGYGRLWKWLYNLLHFFGLEFEQRQFQKALRATHELFLAQQQKALAKAQIYVDYLQSPQSPEGRLIKARHSIEKWHMATASMMRLMRKEATQASAALFPASISSALLTSARLLKNAWHMVQFESLLQERPPLDLIGKLARGGFLEDGQERALFGRFIKKLNKNENLWGIGRLNRALEAWFELCRPDLNNASFNLAALQVALIKYDYRGSAGLDLRHLSKRGRLAYGQEIVCQGRVYRAGHLRRQIDNLSIYQLLNSTHCLAIGPNKAFHRIVNEVSLKYGFGVPLLEYIEIDAHGTCALIGEIGISLANYTWQSPALKLAADELELLRPLAHLLKWCCEQEKFPINLSASFLVYGPDRQLKTLRPCLMGGFDFNKCADFIAQVSNGNFAAYSFLVRSSGLLEHRYARFLARVVVKRINQDAPSVADIAAASSIADGSIIKQAELFIRQLKQLKELCCQHLLAQGVAGFNASDLSLRVGRHIIAALSELGSIGVMPPNFQKLIVQYSLAQM